LTIVKLCVPSRTLCSKLVEPQHLSWSAPETAYHNLLPADDRGDMSADFTWR